MYIQKNLKTQLENVKKSEKGTVFDISTRQLKPLIDMKLLKGIYHDKTPGRRVGGIDSSSTVCAIS